ncbi:MULTISPECIES: cation:proton antiporter [unclassified Curtobacterium]|uniref:cation:proton antiporter domain-containing protein n=1 Tax=unclassified Curtobacterium TaxID=257496 RepID=UPI0015E89687|nr:MULTISPECIES: cation:proton antiporter [unclassified Curtobacterium]WIB33260.1 cation:proton antiporter [Curtobacterium sp. MCSS17_005]
MQLDVVLAVFAGIVVAVSAVSLLLQRFSVPAPLVALVAGVVAGPFALHLIDLDDFGVDPNVLLRESARLTLTVGLAGVALRLPHGYWRRNIRWVASAIGVGMLVMFAVSAGILWLSLGSGLLFALLVGAIMTPTDPIVTTPVVTGSLAKQNIPDRVRFNISSESGINDGLGYPFVLLPVLLLTRPTDDAWRSFLVETFLHEVVGAVLAGAVLGWLGGQLYKRARHRGLMESSSYLGFVIPFAITVLGAARVLGTDGVLAVFVAAAVFGQVIPQADEEQEGLIDDVVNRFLILPVFVLVGVAAPLAAWVGLGWAGAAGVLGALLLRRLIAVWAMRPLIAPLHGRRETLFMSWFGPVGVSALLYATTAAERTGDQRVVPVILFAITCSVVVHGLTSTVFARWLGRSLSP